MYVYACVYVYVRVCKYVCSCIVYTCVCMCLRMYEGVCWGLLVWVRLVKFEF